MSKKGVQGSKKGGSFEREFCKMLSLWWTQGQSKDEFWRTPGSGARANKTKYHVEGGDVRAITPGAETFCNHISIEIKRGYNKIDVMYQLLSGKGMLHQFLAQARTQAKQSNIPHWWLVFKQDRKPTLLIFDAAFIKDAYPKGCINLNGKLPDHIKHNNTIVCTLDSFFENIQLNVIPK